jgi:predicted amidohydrolase
MRVASVQFQHRAGDKAYNLERVESFAREAANDGVNVICFPEMCLTGYWHVRNLSREAIAALAEEVPGGNSVQVLKRLAADYRVLIGAGLIERGDDGRFYNTYVCCLPDGRVERHRKLHCFVNEQMSSGNEYTVFDTPWGVRVGVLICWDNNLIENVRMTALAGADVLLAPHQTGGCRSASPHAMGPIDVALWRNRGQNPAAIEAEFRGPKGREWLLRWLPARAHDNGLFIVFSNGVGEDDGEVRTGNAMIIDCYGRIVTETWQAADAMVVADLDLSLLENCTGRRWMRGRRPELYRAIAEPTGREMDIRAVRFPQAGPSPALPSAGREL